MLLSNAVTHGLSHELPICTVQRENEGVRFDVKDRGPGLPPGTEDAIFARFHRGLDAKPGGLGLGLGIARQLATALNAKLSGENHPGAARVSHCVFPSAES